MQIDKLPMKGLAEILGMDPGHVWARTQEKDFKPIDKKSSSIQQRFGECPYGES
jgi:hypothetical protein